MTDIRCVVRTQDRLGETPLWCERTETLWWLDIENSRLQRFHPASGKHDVFSFDAKFVGSLALRTDGKLLIALDLALHTFDPETGTLALLCQIEPAHLDNRLNDGRCDRRGRFWVGTMDNQLTRPSGALYRVDPDGSFVRLFDDVLVSNTIAFSPDQRTMYFSDTRRYTTWAFDVDIAAGTLSRRRVFADFTGTHGRPDGACVDAEGFVWIAMFAGAAVMRYAPDGRLDRTVEMPTTNPTCLCFGGPGLRTLFVTTAHKFLTPEQLQAQPLAGSLLAFDTDVPGLAEARFGG